MQQLVGSFPVTTANARGVPAPEARGVVARCGCFFFACLHVAMTACP